MTDISVGKFNFICRLCTSSLVNGACEIFEDCSVSPIQISKKISLCLQIKVLSILPIYTNPLITLISLYQRSIFPRHLVSLPNSVLRETRRRNVAEFDDPSRVLTTRIRLANSSCVFAPAFYYHTAAKCNNCLLIPFRYRFAEFLIPLRRRLLYFSLISRSTETINYRNPYAKAVP